MASTTCAVEWGAGGDDSNWGPFACRDQTRSEIKLKKKIVFWRNGIVTCESKPSYFEKHKRQEGWEDFFETLEEKVEAEIDKLVEEFDKQLEEARSWTVVTRKKKWGRGWGNSWPDNGWTAGHGWGNDN